MDCVLVYGAQEAFSPVMVGPYLEVVATLLAAAVGAVPAVAKSSDSSQLHLHLEWSGSESCRPTEDVIDGLRRLLGADPNAMLTQDFAVHAAIDEQARGWNLVLSASGPHGHMERRLDVATCAEVAQVASVVLSLWIQPALSTDNQETGEAIHAVPIEKTVEADAPEALPQEKRAIAREESRLVLQRHFWQVRPGRRLRVLGFVGVAAFSGALPEWGWGVSGGIGAGLDAWRLELLLLWLAPQRKSAALPGLEGEFELLAPGIRVARNWPISSNLNVQPGIWSYVGRLHGEAFGAMTASTPSNDGWGAAGFSTDATLRIWRFTVSLGVGGGRSFGRPRFSVGGYPLYQTSAFVGLGCLAIGTAFP